MCDATNSGKSQRNYDTFQEQTHNNFFLCFRRQPVRGGGSDSIRTISSRHDPLRSTLWCAVEMSSRLQFKKHPFGILNAVAGRIRRVGA